jgi:hypothetical protein
VIGGFGPVQDRGGWEMKVAAHSVDQTSLSFVAGFAPPKFERTTRVGDCADPVNAKTQDLWRPSSYLYDDIQTFDQLNGLHWPGILVEVIGHGYFQPMPGFGLPKATAGDGYRQIVKGSTQWAGVIVQGTTLPISNAIVRVRCFTGEASELSPIYWNGHPVDLIDLLEQEAGNRLDPTAREATRAAIGADIEIAIRVTKTENMGAYLERTCYGPFGIGVRPNGNGDLELFPTQIVASTPPAVTITNADVQRGSTKAFDVDTATAVCRVIINHTRLVPNEQAQAVTVRGTQELDVSAYGPDGFVTQEEQFDRRNGDPGAIGTAEQTYTIPGMVHHKDSWTPDMAAWADAKAAQIFDRRGRGLRRLQTTFVRGGAGDALRLGDEANFGLKQIPNHNKRLGDDASVSARAMQIMHFTRIPTGAVVEVIDSGPNAQPLATRPVLAIAASADAPRSIAEVTITNAAALNAAGYAVRLQRATTTGGAPTAGAYTDFAYYERGKVPTGVIRVMAVSGRTIYAHARSEQSSSSRPSNYSAAVSVTLNAIPAPSALSVRPDPADGSRAAVAWTPGSTADGIVTDVSVRLTAEAAGLSVRRMTLLEGSDTYTLEHLTPAGGYTAGVQHRDVQTGDVSALVEVAFVAGAVTATLDVPASPNGFSGSQDAMYGFPQQDGVYGLAVAATEFPSSVEFAEMVETARNSGVYSALVTVAKQASVQGDWTLWQSVAPNDGKRRLLVARSVGDGATPSEYTDPVTVLPWTSLALGRFSETAGLGEILRVTSAKSADGTAEVFTLVVGALVGSVHAHYRTVPDGETGDYLDFSGDEDVSVDPSLLIERPIDGIATFEIPYPVRAFMTAVRFVPLIHTDTEHKAGASWPDVVRAAPPAINAKIHPARVGAIGSLSIDVAFGPSDADATGVLVDVIQQSLTASTTLVSRRIAAPATLDNGTDAALGNIALPGGSDFLQMYVRITDVSGEPWWFGPANLSRDPVSDAKATLLNYRPDGTAVVSFGPDTDSIRVTSHDGKVKTWDAAALLAAGSPVQYIVGTTPRDDASLEAVLVIDETRSGFKVEAQGGGTWTTILGPVDLHGTPSNPPTAEMRVVKASDASAEDLYIKPKSPVGEQVSPFYRDGDQSTSPTYQLCVSAVDRTARFVASGTEVGPADYFANVDGSGSPSTILSGISLTREQVKRVTIGVQGKDSGVQNWLPYTMSLKEQPWLESWDSVWDEATGAIKARAKGGGHCASGFVEASLNSNFSAPFSTATITLADGADVSTSIAVSGANRGHTVYTRCTPFNQAALAGLAGVAQVASVAVPAVWKFDPVATENTALGQGTLTLTVTDAGLVLDQILKIKFYQTVNGARTGPFVATAAPAGTTGAFVYTFALDPKHNVKIEPIAYFADGSTGILGAWTFDSDKVANCLSVVPVNGKFTAVLTAYFDTDTVVGAATARYRIAAGAWVTFAVSASFVGSFTVNLTANRQTIDVQGQDADGNWGPSTTIQVAPAQITVSPVATENTAAGTGTLTLSVVDSGLVIDQVLKIQFYKTIDGARTGPFAATSGPAATTGDFVYTLTLDPKHNVKVEPIIYYADGSSAVYGAWTFDSDKLANVLSAVPSVNNQTATINCLFDTDTIVGGATGRYRINTGVWVTFAVAAALTGSFNVTLSATAAQTIDIQGQDSDGNWGSSLTIQIGTYDAAPPNGTLSIDPISGNSSAQASVSVRVDLPANTQSVYYKFVTGTSASPPVQPSDATVISTGTLVNASSVLALIAALTVNVGDVIEFVAVPFTGLGGAGTQLRSAHIKSAYTSFGTTTTLAWFRTAWQESSNAPDYTLDGSENIQNPLASAGVVRRRFRIPVGHLVAGKKLTSATFTVTWNTTTNPLGSIATGVDARSGSNINFTNAWTYGGGAQTLTVTLGNYLVAAGDFVNLFTNFLNSVGASADAAQASTSDCSLTYVTPTQDKSV